MGDLAAAVAAIRRGEVVGVPTDTVYGLAADPTNDVAVRRIFELKGRSAHVPLVVLTDTIEAAHALGRFDGRATADTAAHWPGALTAIVASRVSLAAGVGHPETGTIGLRVPDHAACQALLAATGPLAVTSANPSGSAPAVDVEEARAMFGGGVAVYIGDDCGGQVSSTVVDYTTSPPMVLRQGPVTIAGE